MGARDEAERPRWFAVESPQTQSNNGWQAALMHGAWMEKSREQLGAESAVRGIASRWSLHAVEGCDTLIHRLEELEDNGSNPQVWAKRIAAAKQLREAARKAGTQGQTHFIEEWVRQAAQERDQLEMVNDTQLGALHRAAHSPTAHPSHVAHASHTAQVSSQSVHPVGYRLGGSGTATLAGSGSAHANVPAEKAVVARTEQQVDAMTNRAKAAVHNLEHSLAKAKSTGVRVKLAREENAALVKRSRDEVKERFVKYEASQAAAGHLNSASKALGGKVTESESRGLLKEQHKEQVKAAKKKQAAEAKPAAKAKPAPKAKMQEAAVAAAAKQKKAAIAKKAPINPAKKSKGFPAQVKE